MQATSEDNDLGNIKNILSRLEETPIEPKELREKGYIKPFQKLSLELYNGLIYYFNTPHMDRVRQLMLRVAPVNFRRVVM